MHIGESHTQLLLSVVYDLKYDSMLKRFQNINFNKLRPHNHQKNGPEHWTLQKMDLSVCKILF